jgi:hypothetical protein
MTAAAPIPFATRPARCGREWLARAWVMFTRRPATWLALLFVYYVLMVLANLLPLVGPLAWVLLKPVLGVGFLAAAWAQERGDGPRVADLFRGFQSNLRALMPLGVVFVVGISAAIFASALVDGGRLLALATGSEKLTEEALQDALQSRAVQGAMLFSALCATPVVLALWFAPALVVFNDAGTWRALSTSLRACLANWRPASVYGLWVFVFGVIVPSVLMGVVLWILPSGAGALVALGLIAPYELVFVATLQISDYVGYRDVFHPDEHSGPTAPAGIES